MDRLEEKLKEIQELIKAQDVPPSPKPPAPPTPPSPDAIKAPEAPKSGQANSKKDPVKVAQQLKDGTKDETVKQAKKLKEGVTFNKSGQWSIDEEELEKSIKKKLGALAVAGSALMGGGGEAKADIGHLKGYLKSMHGMELGGHQVEVQHKDTSREEFKGTNVGSGKFRLKIGDFHIDGQYGGAGDDYSKIKLSKPYHHELKHQPYEGKSDTQYLDDKGADEAESLHEYLSGSTGNAEDKSLSLHHHLQLKRKAGDKRGLDIGNFNIKKNDDL